VDKVSEYVQGKENWNNVRETPHPKTPLFQLPLTFHQPADHGRSGGLSDSQRVRMQTTGRLRVTSGKIRNPAAAAQLLSQFSTAAQENLFTIAVDKNDNIVEVHRYSLF